MSREANWMPPDLKIETAGSLRHALAWSSILNERLAEAMPLVSKDNWTGSYLKEALRTRKMRALGRYPSESDSNVSSE